MRKISHEEFVEKIEELVGNEYSILGIYLNSQTEIKMKHNLCGNEYMVKPNKFLTGRRCPPCSIKARAEKRKGYTIEDMKRTATERGGECLSSDYVNSKSKLLWKCADGHIWEAVPYEVVNQKTWCKICSTREAGLKRRLTIEGMHQIAKSRGGKCLSTEYNGSSVKLKWQCAKGHIWEAIPENVKNRRSWCPTCSRIASREKKIKYAIKDLQKIAAAKGGECLSKEYQGANVPLLWRCSEGHTWEAKPSKIILYGSWCSRCAGKARLTIEEMHELAAKRGGICLSKKYINLDTKLTWKCADGHVFEATPDNIKHGGSWCPRCSKYITEDKCRFIFEQLTGHEFPKVRNVLGNRFELDGYNDELHLAFEYHGEQHYRFVDGFYKNQEELKKRREMDTEKETRCRDKGIHLIVVPYWESESDEKLFDFIMTELLKTSISVHAANKELFFDDFYQNLSRLTKIIETARERGGECLSKTYNGNHDKLKFRCSEGHVFYTTPYLVKTGTWCRKCAGTEKLTIEEMHELARSKGGECLSHEYINSTTKLDWRCEKNHTFRMKPASVKQGHWCPKCAGLERLTMEEMHEIAKSRGGKCLSSEYVNNNTELLWECARGHQWWAIPSSIKNNNTWCITCSGKKKKTIEEVQEIAKQHGGYLLSDHYENNMAKLKWRCKHGHIFEKSIKVVMRGFWCNECKKS